MDETKKCEHCGKDINISYKVCPLCGGHQGETPTPAPPVCPRCKAPLKTSVINDEEYNVCPSCSGMWLDRVKFHRATTEYDVFKKTNFKDEYKKQPLRESIEYIPCVRCGKLMNRKNFNRISGVMIDECGSHGVWLDSGEFERIRHFIADGGLERSQDKEIETNRLKIEEVAMEQQDTAFLLKILHFWKFKRWIFG
ncbi:MAG: zf-TFIIB domain-containing protein [Nitrospirae bacterium]|nr:zf-TFIIB domain-containing protein [Nitrospirota bacterium]